MFDNIQAFDIGDFTNVKTDLINLKASQAQVKSLPINMKVKCYCSNINIKHLETRTNFSFQPVDF